MPRTDWVDNGLPEDDRVDPRGLRGPHDRHGLLPLLPPDLPRRAPGGLQDPRERDREEPPLLRRLPPREARRVPRRGLVRGDHGPRGRPRGPPGRDGPPRLLRGGHGLRELPAVPPAYVRDT